MTPNSQHIYDAECEWAERVRGAMAAEKKRGAARRWSSSLLAVVSGIGDNEAAVGVVAGARAGTEIGRFGRNYWIVCVI
jgi:hypothetical protein